MRNYQVSFISLWVLTHSLLAIPLSSSFLNPSLSIRFASPTKSTKFEGHWFKSSTKHRPLFSSPPLEISGGGQDEGNDEESECDLVVVGCGVLGTSLCRQLVQNIQTRQQFLNIQSVVGVTGTTNNHASILESVQNTDQSSSSVAQQPSFCVKTYDEIILEKRKYKNVVFCAPPSKFDNYAEALENVMDDLWDQNAGGVFAFTSSGGVYEGKDGETVNENFPTIDPEKNPRQGRIVYAERTCIAKKGTVLRLAGLYTLDRGAHNYWLTSGKTVQGRPSAFVNLLSYDDAASACIAALVAAGRGVAVRGKTYLISDGNPTTREGICQSALKSKQYGDGKYTMPSFENDGPLGKIYDGSFSNTELKWTPTYESFDKFMTSH